MAKAKSAISLGVVSLVVIAIILIVGFGVFLSTILNTGTTSVSSSNTSTQSTTPATSTSIMPTQSSSNSLSGLRLDLFVAPSNLSYGEVINVDEYNALNSLNNVRNNNEFQYPANSLNPYDPCGLIGPVGFAVFQGYFDLSNYTTATALRLYNETGDTCITTVSVQNSYYSFKPQSDLATLVYPSGTFADTNATVAMSFITKGYWTGGFITGTSTTFHNFTQGSYTVLAADEWGKVVLVHFAVTSTGFSSGTSTFTSGSLIAQSSSNPNTSDELVCVSTNYQVLGSESISVQNGTTFTSSVSTFTTSYQTTFTTTTTESQTVGYGTTTTSYSPPSSWSVVSCTYTSTK